MKSQGSATGQAVERTRSAATLSLVAVSATVILAAITHAAEFGYRALIAGLIGIALLCCMSILYQRTKKNVFLLFYGALNAWVIIGFGLVNGFWNHAFKVFLTYLHNGSLPPFLAKLFMTPHTGSFLYEGAGALTFVLSMVASYYGYRLIKEGR